MVEKSHILKSPFIHLYVSPTNFDTETFFGQNNLFHTVAASIFDSIFLRSSHACACRAGRAQNQNNHKECCSVRGIYIIGYLFGFLLKVKKPLIEQPSEKRLVY